MTGTIGAATRRFYPALRKRSFFALGLSSKVATLHGTAIGLTLVGCQSFTYLASTQPHATVPAPARRARGRQTTASTWERVSTAGSRSYEANASLFLSNGSGALCSDRRCAGPALPTTSANGGAVHVTSRLSRVPMIFQLHHEGDKGFGHTRECRLADPMTAARALRPLAGPTDDVFFQPVIGDIGLTGRHASTHRHARTMHRLRIAGHQRMPPCKVFAFRHQAIGTSRRQPLEAAHIARCQPNAILHLGLAMRIVATAATLAIEQFTTDVGKHGRVGILVDQLVQAASAAAIAQALPFGTSHFRHRLAAPEGNLRIGHVGNLSMRSGCTCSQAASVRVGSCRQITHKQLLASLDISGLCRVVSAT